MTAPTSDFVSSHPKGTCIAIKLQPRSAKNMIGQALSGELKIRVTAAPVDDAANDSLLRLLADRLACSRSALEITRGKTSRHKLVLVTGLDAATVRRRLQTD